MDLKEHGFLIEIFITITVGRIQSETFLEITEGLGERYNL